MTLRKKRVYQKNAKTPAERAREKATRERFQREKPSLNDLISDGEYGQPVSQGEYIALMELAARIRETRKKQNLSLADIAKRSGIDKAALSRLENGKADNPTVGTLARIAESVGKRIRITLEDLPAT